MPRLLSVLTDLSASAIVPYSLSSAKLSDWSFYNVHQIICLLCSVLYWLPPSKKPKSSQWLLRIYIILHPILSSFIPLQPHWPSCCSLNTPSSFSPQSLCSSWTFYQECSHPRSPNGLLFHFSQVSSEC